MKNRAIKWLERALAPKPSRDSRMKMDDIRIQGASYGDKDIKASIWGRDYASPRIVSSVTIRWTPERANVKSGDLVQVSNDIFTVVGRQETLRDGKLVLTYDLAPYAPLA